MLSVITGDIVNSRNLGSPEIWLNPLKNLLNEWGSTPGQWEVFKGDYFQVETGEPLMVLHSALRLKALFKSMEVYDRFKRKSSVDVRLAIGIGEKDYSSGRISESTGTAFIFSGEKFESLKKEKLTLAVKTHWGDFDEEINLYLKLIGKLFDNWSVSSAQLATLVLKYPNENQTEIGTRLGIEQNSVSGRYKRANLDLVMEVEQMFRKKLSDKLYGNAG